MKFLILISLLLPLYSFASGCEEVNLVTKKNSPFKKIPVYDQDGIGICYAYSASQLVDYELIKKGGERSVHPFWLALKYAEEENSPKITGGIASTAIDELRSNGNCHRDKISKSLAKWAKEANVQEAELLGFIEKLVPKINKASRDGLFTSFPFSFDLEKGQLETILNETIKEFSPYCSNGSSFEKLLPQLKDITTITSRRVLGSLVFNDCKETTKLKIPKTITFSSETDADYSKQLKNKLNKIDAPLSISYCSNTLKDPAYDGISRSTWNSRRKFDSKCGAHESIIVGKKLLNGQCHFLLRNTWGSGFGSYTKNWKCLCKNKKTGAFLDNCDRSKHNNGTNIVEGCWISEAAINKNTFEITHLSEK